MVRRLNAPTRAMISFHVDRFANHVIDPGCEQPESLLQRIAVVHRDDRRLAAALDETRIAFPLGTIADQNGFDRGERPDHRQR